MTLPASGAISMSQVNVELSRAWNAAISLDDVAVRDLAGVPSGAISMSQLHGKSASAPLSASASPSYIFKGTPGSGVQNSGVITINPAGGTGSYTYSWSVLSNTAGGNFANGTTSQTNSWNSDSFGLGSGVRQTVVRCTVTSGGSSVNVDITIDWEWTA
jgi:hypothetical protein